MVIVVKHALSSKFFFTPVQSRMKTKAWIFLLSIYGDAKINYLFNFNNIIRKLQIIEFRTTRVKKKIRTQLKHFTICLLEDDISVAFPIDSTKPKGSSFSELIYPTRLSRK